MLHAESLRYFGGLAGLRDQALLQSALDRPRNKWAFGKTTNHFELAAAYAYGIAANHAFIDGNKRTALLSVRAFLFRNGHRLAPGEAETVTVIDGLAAGDLDETFITKWITDNTEALT